MVKVVIQSPRIGTLLRRFGRNLHKVCFPVKEKLDTKLALARRETPTSLLLKKLAGL
jgi:hypothetical protein